MLTTAVIILIAIDAILVVLVAVLLWLHLRHDQELHRKDDTIVREIRDNANLRDQLYHHLTKARG